MEAARAVIAVAAGLIGAAALGASVGYAVLHGRVSRIGPALFLAGGLALGQAWQTWLVRQHNWPLKGFPNFDVPSWIGYVYLSVLFGWTFGMTVWVAWNPERAVTRWAILLIPVAFSQLFGRGLIRGGFDAIFVLVVLLLFLLDQTYPLPVLETLGIEKRRFIYGELWEVLKISVTIGMFYLGTVGVAFAIQFLREQYFRGESLAPWQMYRYGTLFIYSVVGICTLFVWPLLKRILLLRAGLLE